MKKHLHMFDEDRIQAYSAACQDSIQTELDKAGTNYVITYVPVVLIESSEGEYTVAKTVNPRNILRVASESTMDLMEDYEKENVPDVLEFTRN